MGCFGFICYVLLHLLVGIEFEYLYQSIELSTDAIVVVLTIIGELFEFYIGVGISLFVLIHAFTEFRTKYDFEHEFRSNLKKHFVKTRTNDL